MLRPVAPRNNTLFCRSNDVIMIVGGYEEDAPTAARVCFVTTSVIYSTSCKVSELACTFAKHADCGVGRAMWPLIGELCAEQGFNRRYTRALFFRRGATADVKEFTIAVNKLAAVIMSQVSPISPIAESVLTDQTAVLAGTSATTCHETSSKATALARAEQLVRAQTSSRVPSAHAAPSSSPYT